MTVFVESIISLRRDATGQVSEWRIGIVEWPYEDLTPVQAILVKKGLDREDPDDPLYLIILMNDQESTLTTILRGTPEVRQFVESELSRSDNILLTRFPNFSKSLGGQPLTTGITHYEVNVRVAETTEEAIASMASVPA